MARKVFRHSQGRRNRELMHPVREWFIGLTAFLLVAGAGSAWVWSEYDFYQTLSPVSGQVEMEVSNYHEVAVEAALARYQEKQQIYDELINAEPLAEIDTTELEAESATTTITTSSPQESETAGSVEGGGEGTNTDPGEVPGPESDPETAAEPEPPSEPPIGQPLIGE